MSKRVFSMITNKYYRTTSHINCHILGKRNGRIPVFSFSFEDEKLVRSHRWNITNKKYPFCVCHNYQLSRLLMDAPKDQEVDHRDRNPQNNCRYNLRIVTHAENMRNRMANSNKTYGIPVKGVYWGGASWCVETHKNGAKWSKRGFETLPEAICYKIRREYELFGDKSPNYRPILKKMPRRWLLTYLPEIYSHRNQEFIGSPIFNAHYKNSNHKSWHKHLLGVRKAGATM